MGAHTQKNRKKTEKPVFLYATLKTRSRHPPLVGSDSWWFQPANQDSHVESSQISRNIMLETTKYHVETTSSIERPGYNPNSCKSMLHAYTL